MKLLLALFTIISSLNVEAITIGTYNIRNFDYDTRSRVKTDKSALTSILESLNADVLSVQEINNTDEFHRFVARNLPGYKAALSECGGAHGQKLGFLYNTKTVDLLEFTEDVSLSNPGSHETCHDGSRPMAIGKFQIKENKQKFFGVSVHLKSGSQANSVYKRNQQYSLITEKIKDLKYTTGIQDYYIAGDFNTTEFISRGSDYLNLGKVVSTLGMVSLTQRVACTAYWWGGSDDGIETPSILDHLIVTPGLIKTAKPVTNVGGHCQKVRCQQVSERDLGVSYEGVSDHCPITATIQ